MNYANAKKFSKILLYSLLAIGFFVAGDRWATFFSSDSNSKPIYRIASDLSWYPLELYGLEGDITGFTLDLAQAIANEKKINIRVDVLDTNSLFQELDQGAYDGIFSSNIPNEVNSGDFLASEPYYLLGPVVVVARGSNIKSLFDLQGKTVGVIARSPTVLSLDKVKSLNISFYDYPKRFTMLEDVVNNRIDGMVLNVMPAYVYTHSVIYRNLLKIVTAPLNKDGLHLFTKTDPASQKLIETFNSGLDLIKKKGIYDQLIHKWELFNPDKVHQNVISSTPKLPHVH